MDAVIDFVTGISEGITNYFGKYDSLKEFLVDNGRNPFFWVAIFIIGLIIYLIVYNALHKEN